MRYVCLSLPLVLLTAMTTIAQETLPDSVARFISEETIVVVRIDVKASDPTVFGPLLRDWPDPTGPNALRAGKLDQALQKLKPLGTRDLFLVLDTAGLPLDGLAIVPAASPPVVAALTSVWPDDVEEVDGCAIAGDQSARLRARTQKSGNRVEFKTALQSLQGTSIQVAIAPSADSRRVLREFLPVIPVEFGGGMMATIADGTNWVGLGINLPRSLEIRLITQAANPAVAQAQQRAIAATLATIFAAPSVKEVLPKSDEIRQLLTPKVENDRILLSLNEANGGARRVVDEVGKPLAELARAQARRSRNVANLKTLGLAMHMYFDANKTFPLAASRSRDGRPLLSWRVLILPYVDQKALYDQFHLDEPWDSEHNKGLIEKMPAIFEAGNIGTEQRNRGLTTYLVPTGEKTVFGKPDGVKIRDITDGTANTILIVDALADRAVVWTRPDDLPVDFKSPWTGLASPPKGFFWCTFCDGSARRIDGTTSAENLRRYFQMNDGEVIDQE